MTMELTKIGFNFIACDSIVKEFVERIGGRSLPKNEYRPALV